MYEFGRGVEEDRDEALRWYRLSAEQGDRVGQFYLGRAHNRYDSTPEEQAIALTWLVRSAELGLGAGARVAASLMSGMGSRALEAGQNERAHIAHALRRIHFGTFLLTAIHRVASGRYSMLGDIFHAGLGVAQNFSQAAKRYQLAAEQGQIRAQARLGHLYERGLGVEQSYAEAARWYRSAASEGDRRARAALAALYFRGNGVPKDLILAHKWVNLAERASYLADERDSYLVLLAEIAEGMTRAQIDEALRLAGDVPISVEIRGAGVAG